MRLILNSTLMALLGALALGPASVAATDKPWNFSVHADGPEALTVGCAWNQGSTIAVDSTGSVTCQGKASYNTFVYFGDRKAREPHNCPVNESTYVRYISYSYDSTRDNRYQVEETYCEVIATPADDSSSDTDGADPTPGAAAAGG